MKLSKTNFLQVLNIVNFLTDKQNYKKNNIKFKEYDVDTNAKGRIDYNKMGAKGVPVILVGKNDGDFPS